MQPHESAATSALAATGAPHHPGSAAFLAVAAGGGTGAVARHAVGVWLLAAYPGSAPWPTLAINLAGSLLLGLVIGRFPHQPRLRALLAVGFCGGFTTFGTVSHELLDMTQQARWGTAALYAGASVAGCILGVWAGMRVWQRPGLAGDQARGS